MRKWNGCTFLSGSKKIEDFFSKRNKNLLIIGKGFDPRACRSLEVFGEINKDIWIIDYNEKPTIQDDENSSRSKDNYTKLMELIREQNWKELSIPMYKISSVKKTLIISESLRGIILKENISNYKNIIVDISAMPRAVGFSLIKRIMDIKSNQKIHILVCENSECDDNIKPVIVEGSAEYLQGFKTFSMLAEADEDETIWLPVLGSNDKAAFNIIADYLKPVEICPIVPFPSQNLRRGENILRYYGEILFKERDIEKRNIIYVPECFPLLVYQKLYDTVKYYEKVLNNEQNRTIKYAFSSQSSKLIDIGILLTIIALGNEKMRAGIVVVENQGYHLNEAYNVNSEKFFCICLDDYEFSW